MMGDFANAAPKSQIPILMSQIPDPLQINNVHGGSRDRENIGNRLFCNSFYPSIFPNCGPLVYDIYSPVNVC